MFSIFLNNFDKNDIIQTKSIIRPYFQYPLRGASYVFKYQLVRFDEEVRTKLNCKEYTIEVDHSQHLLGNSLEKKLASEFPSSTDPIATYGLPRRVKLLKL
ncbi:unnamed protein product [Allacma fusca]|uniref:Uncharacterized protein n=1 Tax=Allacma fusca TaxID=39272 RepID=A0A8J2NSY2_9HEXA|nr:unnamed protein product [Allacma fusca]